MAVLQCCPLVFCAIFALLPFFLFLRCVRPCAAPLPVAYTIPDISEASLFITPIGFLSTRDRLIRLPRPHLTTAFQRREGGGGVLPMMAYTERLCPKGVPFSGFKCMKGSGFHLLKKKNI